MAIDRKTTPSATLPKITPQMAKSTEGGKASLMRTIRAELGESAAQFGATIAHTIDRHHRPFSRKYISALENSHARITPQIETALLRIAAALDESDPDLAVMQEVSVMVIDAASAGALVKGKARSCARAGCRMRFVPASPAQKFHNARCRELNKKSRGAK